MFSISLGKSQKINHLPVCDLKNLLLMQSHSLLPPSPSTKIHLKIRKILSDWTERRGGVGILGLVFPCSLNKLYLSRIFHPITLDNLSSRPAAVGTNMPLSGKEKKTSKQFTSHLKVKERQRVFVVFLLKTKHRVSNLMPLRTLYIIVS